MPICGPAKTKSALAKRTCVLGLIAALGSASCGSKVTDSSPLLDPSQVRSTVPAVEVTASGATPTVLHLDAPVTVTFTNHDAVAHRFDAAPELGYGPCPELAELGLLEPGKSGSMTLTRTQVLCAYHDATMPANKAFQGVVVLH